MDYSSIQEGGLTLPTSLNPADILAQAKAAAAKSATDAIAANPMMAQIQGITGTLKDTVKAVADAPATIKQVVQDTVAESTGQAPPAEGEAPAEEMYTEEAPANEEAPADESWFGGGGQGYTMLDKPLCYRTYGPVYVTHDRNNIQIVPIKLGNRRLKHKLTKKIPKRITKKHQANTKKILKKGVRKTSRKSGKRRSRRS